MDATTYIPATRDDLAEALAQLGRDEMAQALADLLNQSADEDQLYRDGVEDALNVLVQAGAVDPRPATNEERIEAGLLPLCLDCGVEVDLEGEDPLRRFVHVDSRTDHPARPFAAAA